MITTHRGVLVVDLHDPHLGRIRVRVPAEQRTPRKSQAFERVIRAQLAEGIDPRAKESAPQTRAPTIAAYVDRYLDELEARGRKVSTITSARRLLRKWIVPAVGAARIDAVRTADFTTVRHAMRAKAPKTINNALVVLGAMVRHWHAEHDRTPPAFRVGLVKVPKSTAPKFFPDPELEQLVAAAEGPARVLLLLGVDAGLRMSEIRALQWSDISERAVTVSRTREGGVEYAPKGWRSRTIPLSSRLAAALREHVRGLKDPHVLLDRWGAPLTRRMVGQRFETLVRTAGVTRLSFHATRHTFCTRLAAAGVPVRTIQELAGHADLATSQRYMHAAPGAVDDAIRRLG